MSESCNVEYFLLKYVPNVIEDASILIAAILVDPEDLENGMCTIRVAADWRNKVRFLDPGSDLEILEAILTEIRDQLLSKQQRSEIIRQMEDSFSNVLRVSRRGRCSVAPTPENIEALTWRLLENPSTASSSSVLSAS